MTVNDTAIRDLYARLLAAWNGRDRDEFAGLFAPDGVLIGFDGSTAQGREIREHLETVFRDHETAAYVAKVRDMRPLGSEGALLRAIAGMVPPGGSELNAEVNALHSLVVERVDGNWRIVLFQNTPAQFHGRPELVDAQTAELEQARASGEAIT